MVLWLTILSYILFLFYIFIKYGLTETLNKSSQHLYIYTGFHFLCQASLSLCGFKQLNTPKPVPSQRVFTSVPC